MSLLWLVLLYLDGDLGDKNITQGHLPDSASPDWITLILPSVQPGITESANRKLIFPKERNLLFMPALIAWHWSYF